MNINWAALKSAKKEVTPFFSIILGPSGAGKSTLIGSLKKPTLYLYTSVEDHGPVAARAINPNIIPVCLDRSDKGESLTADQAYERTLEILADKTIADNVEAIAVDGATELDQIIRKTKSFTQYCKTDKGTHNSFREGEAVNFHLKTIIESMKALQGKGLHCMFTCAALTKSVDDSGMISEVTPKLLGFESASDLIRQFADVLLVSRITIGTETNPEPAPHHILMFHANITKQSKDLKGVVVKTANFSPRVSGILIEELPPVMKADLSLLLEYKNKK